MNEAAPEPTDPTHADLLALCEALMGRIIELEEGYNAVAEVVLQEKDKLEMLMRERANRIGSSAINKFIYESDRQTERNIKK